MYNLWRMKYIWYAANEDPLGHKFQYHQMYVKDETNWNGGRKKIWKKVILELYIDSEDEE